LRIEPDRLVVVLDGAVELAFGPVNGAAIVEGGGILRIEPDRVRVGLNYQLWNYP
jgi:hypothetical protein